MRVAITGVSGLLGGNLAALARERGHTVVGLHRASSARNHLADLGIEWALAPLHEPDALRRALENAEVVFHCAARTSMLPHPTPALIAANVHGTDAVLSAAREVGVPRVVHVSSTVAVGVSTDGQPCTEESAFNLEEHGLADGYARTKHESEQRALRAAVEHDVVVVNPGFLFGPRDARPSSGTMILQVARGAARLASAGRNCFVSAADVACGAWLAYEHGRRGERYILGGENWTYREAFGRIAAIVGAAPPLAVAPEPVARLVGLGGDLVQAVTGREQPVTTQTVRWGYAQGFVFDSSKARRELGYAPGDPEDGIRAAWAWFRDHGRA